MAGADQRPAPSAPWQNQRSPCLAQASQSPGHQPDLFFPDLNRKLGWHARESRSWAASSALAVLLASLRASAHTHAAQELNVARYDILRDNE